MKFELFTGAATALITPFKHDGSIDVEGLKDLIEFQIKNGIQAILIAGTTGEACTLEFEEFSLLIAKANEFIQKRIPLIAGAGTNNTATSIKRSLEAQKRGADALLVVTPYYNKTTQEGLLYHYYEIANRIRIPMILYNIPIRTGMSITPATCKHLSEHPKIIGIKEASGNISFAADLASKCPRLSIYSGNDDQILPILSLGGKGIISVISNLYPARIQKICNLYRAGDHESAIMEQIQLLPLIRLLFSEINPIPIKCAMKLRGLPAGTLRPPLIDCSNELEQKIKQELDRLGA